MLFKEIDGQRCEPIEELTIDLPESMSGTAIDKVTMRKGEMQSMQVKGDRVFLGLPFLLYISIIGYVMKC